MKPQTVVESLTRAKALLTPERWGQGLEVVMGMDGDRKLCTMQALGKATLDPAYRDFVPFYAARDVLYRANSITSGAEWNDRSSYQQVLFGFDLAIALATEEGL